MAPSSTGLLLRNLHEVTYHYKEAPVIIISSHELKSKLLNGGYIGDYIGDYYRGY